MKASSPVPGMPTERDHGPLGSVLLYTRFTDVWDAVEHLRDILEASSWDQPEFYARVAVI